MDLGREIQFIEYARSKSLIVEEIRVLVLPALDRNLDFQLVNLL